MIVAFCTADVSLNSGIAVSDKQVAEMPVRQCHLGKEKGKALLRQGVKGGFLFPSPRDRRHKPV